MGRKCPNGGIKLPPAEATTPGTLSISFFIVLKLFIRLSDESSDTRTFSGLIPVKPDFENLICFETAISPAANTMYMVK
jgi:hypothetical protein